MDRRGFLGIMVFAAAGIAAGFRLVNRFRREGGPEDSGLREAMFYRKA